MTHSWLSTDITIDPAGITVTVPASDPDGVKIQLSPHTYVCLDRDAARALTGAIAVRLGESGAMKTLGVLLRGLEFDNNASTAADFRRALADLGITVPADEAEIEQDEPADVQAAAGTENAEVAP